MTSETNTLTAVDKTSTDKTTITGTISDPTTQNKAATRILANYVGGCWVPASAPGLLNVTNPASGEILARVPLSGITDVEGAVAAAGAALPDWRSRSVGER